MLRPRRSGSFSLALEEFDETFLERVEVGAQLARGPIVDEPAFGEDADVRAEGADLLRVGATEERVTFSRAAALHAGVVRADDLATKLGVEANVVEDPRSTSTSEQLYDRACICVRMHTLDALGEPTRRQILAELRPGRLCVNDIAERVGLHQSGVSRHLRVLEEAQFVNVQPAGQQRYYTLRPEGFLEVADWAASYKFLWEARLDRIGQEIDRRQRARATKERSS